VILGFKTIAGDSAIKINQVDGLLLQRSFIEDKMLNKIHDLKKSGIYFY
jgi:hypothetical protein